MNKEEKRNFKRYKSQSKGEIKIGTETYKGSLKDFRLADILIGFQRGTKTGILKIESGSQVKKLFIKNGDIVFAVSNDKEEQLGELLLKEGRITLEEYNQSNDLTIKTGQRLEKVLVKLGYLTSEEVSKVVKHQVEEIILNLFTIEEGKFEFHDGYFPEEEKIDLCFSTADLIYKGIKRINNFTYLKKLCPPIDAVLNSSSEPLNIFQDIAFEDTDKNILSYINGLYSIKIILLFSPSNDFETLKTICALLSIGLIKVKREDEAPSELPEGIFGEPPEKMAPHFVQNIEEMYKKYETLDYYDVMGIEKDASSEEIKKAFYKISKKYHPDIHYSLPPDNKEIKRKLIKILSYFTEAYETLSDPVKRQEYNKTLSRQTLDKAQEISKGTIGFKDESRSEVPTKAKEKAEAFPEEVPAIKQAKTKPKTRRKKTLLYIPAIIVIAVGLIVAFLLYKKIHKGPQPAVPPATKERIPLPPFRNNLFDKLLHESEKK